jgi:L-xylulokinase
MEATAYAIKANLHQAERISRRGAADIAVGGGMTRSSTWTGILVDVLGRQVRLSPTPYVSALGAYLCAATCIGEFPSLEEAARSAGGLLRSLEPDSRGTAEYQDHYQHWLAVEEGMKGLSL